MRIVPARTLHVYFKRPLLRGGRFCFIKVLFLRRLFQKIRLPFVCKAARLLLCHERL